MCLNIHTQLIQQLESMTFLMLALVQDNLSLKRDIVLCPVEAYGRSFLVLFNFKSTKSPTKVIVIFLQCPLEYFAKVGCVTVEGSKC